ncbi:DUF5104 domain-containing protein [Clostridium botulinum]|nr:DUF5104 domain-containing protein [Clostridium botulinum]NFR15352.1 DUF5104 domain-containing protein [Clostridium botulinum]NFR45070.1 DUF5104 domain-containing protein [Clostridium botulinum]NFS50403.1 DUF5104 domain-containing protein [Clostridium botulinum]
MNIKRTTIFIIVTIISLSLISCGTLRNKMINERLNILNSSNDNEVADKCVEKIINFIENKDKEGLKEIFAPSVLQEVNDIDGGIDYVIDFYKGKMESRSEATTSRLDSSADGKRITELRCMYTVTTNEDNYIVFFINRTADSKESNNIGVSMLQIIKESDKKNEFDAGEKKTRCAGIYMPDSAK